jgi:hypothetical protein
MRFTLLSKIRAAAYILSAWAGSLDPFPRGIIYLHAAREDKPDMAILGYQSEPLEKILQSR